ncbi:hypothetical protein HK097_002886 [Rhizophlyctis rosea]|uniref:Uncharacterized protein n=1 Tax=Rhizophlyctis rosea TaxID=64517 RepID=A0AAD5S353_9FUNG|nr:hypothetical protein HK097_002886 [Rhizophlyctis rosea]
MDSTKEEESLTPQFRRQSSGVDLKAPTTIRRPEILRKVLQDLENIPTALVRASAQCGKTALVKLLTEYVAQNLPARLVLPVDCLDRRTNESFEAFFLRMTNKVFMDFFNPTAVGPITYLLVDEAQKMYLRANEDSIFWDRVKRLGSMESPTLRILFFSNYTLDINITGTRPIEFIHTYGASDVLTFNATECRLFMEQWRDVVWQRYEGLGISEEVMEALTALSGGHIGILSNYMEAINDFFVNKAKATTIQSSEVLSFLPTKSCYDRLISTRGITKLSVVSQDEIAHLRLLAPHTTFPYDESYNSLINKGFLNYHWGTPDFPDSYVTFTSPIQRQYCLRELNKPTRTAHGTLPATLADLCLGMLSKFSLSSLRNQRLGPGNLMKERSWQMEVHRCLLAYLGPNGWVTPDVSPARSTDAVDFYVRLKDHRVWLVEVLREGLLLDQPSSGFISNGAYTRIPHDDYILLDFHAPKVPRQYLEHMWGVEYATDLSHCTVRKSRWDSVKVAFRGDVDLGHQSSTGLLADVVQKIKNRFQRCRPQSTWS